MRTNVSIELLESRIAPAVLVVSPSTATYTDVDGDFVTIKVSTGDLAGAGFSSIAVGLGEQLRQIDLGGGGFDGANLTLTVKKSATGDGLANVGHIFSPGHDLGAVTIPGDLGQIDAGDSDPAKPAIKSLTVRSMGRFGTATQGAAPSLQSGLDGALGALTVKGDVVGVFLDVNDGADGTIGSVTISGSLIGGGTTDSGHIQSSGKMGAVKIGGSVVGAAGSSSGAITSNASIGAVTIGGDLRGGSNNGSGVVTAVTTLASITVGGSVVGGSAGDTGEIKTTGNMGPVKIGRDFIGGTATVSGLIECAAGDLTSVTIAGSMIGGTSNSTGKINVNNGKLGPVKIGRDLIGGSITGADFANQTGFIFGQRIVSVAIGGSIIAGTDDSTGTLTGSASIRAGDDLGPVTIKGSLIGNALVPVIISARGQAAQTATDLAIASVTVGGRVEQARILAGYDVNLNAANGDAQIGTIKAGGDWIASSAVAGIKDTGLNDFGDGDDALFAVGSAITARIAAIQIGGVVIGTAGAGDHFGFVAQQIGSFKSLGFTAPLTAATTLQTFELSLVTADVTIREI